MGLGRLRRHDVEERGWQNWWNMAGAPGYISAKAYSIGGSTEQALTNSASWACINILSDAFGRTPLDVVRGDGAGRRPVSPTPHLIADPSGIVLTDVWRFQLGWSLTTDGNAFGEIMSYTGPGYPDRIELLDPYTVTERKVVGGVPQVKVGNQVRQLYPFGTLWHMPGRSVAAGSPFGLSPVEQAAKAIGTSLAAEEFSFQFFDEGGHPSSIIYSAKDITSDQAAAIKNAWRRATTGTREVAVLGADLKHEQIQTNPGETQFLETERYAVEKVCRFWGVPPGMVYGAVSGQAITYANVTDADLNFLKHSLDVYYVRVENALTDLLPRPQTVKANRNAILRGDPKSRFEMYTVALANRQITVNEIRALEDLPGFGPEYDTPGIPGGTQPIGQMVREITPGVGVVVTSDEARAILNEHGAGLSIPGPDELGPAAQAAQGQLDLQGGASSGTP